MGDDSIFEKIPEMNYSEKAAEVEPEAFTKVVESRRSVRVYDSTPIPEEVMNKCLDLALLAPNSSNLQPWEFYWVRDPEKKARLVEACFGQPAAKTASEIIVSVARTKTWRKNAQDMLELMEKQDTPVPESVVMYYKKLVPMAYTLGVCGLIGRLRQLAMFFVGLIRPVPRGMGSRKDLITWSVKSSALACENLMLALRAYGFDSCPMEGMDTVRVAKILGLPSDAVVVMAISAGRRAENGVYGKRLRFERDRFIKEV